jgi:endonuclease/exonuclease/phosphatase family metal-dependent hydrolase
MNIGAISSMKNRWMVWLLMLWGFYSCELPIADETDRVYSDTLQVGTYNVRIATPVDEDHRSWCFRRNYIALQIYTHHFDLFGVQELMDAAQEQELKRLLPDYAFYAKGNGDATGNSGQRIAIVYEKHRFECQDSGFFFLSETPEYPTVAWDAEFVHLCQWVRLHDRHTLKDFYFFNTHLSWCGKEARKNSVQQILSRIRLIPLDLPVLLGGDMNAPPTETDTYGPLATNLSDSRLVAETQPEGYVGTFNNWEPTPWNFTETRRYDYLFVRHVQVIGYQTLNEQYVDDCWPSDHFPILLSVVL